MHPAHRFARSLPLLALLLAGCGKSGQVLAPESSQSSQETSASEELARHPELVEDGMYETHTQAPVASGEQTTQGAAAIHPLFFWREIRQVERAFEFAFRDTDDTGQPTVAVVTVHKRLAGTFNVVAGDGDGEGEGDGRLVRKPLRDHWVRRILLHRVEREGRRPWRIAATSGVEVTSRAAETRIESLRVQSGPLDTVITDVKAFFRLRRILRFEVGAEVTLTATTLRADDVVILYLGDRRRRFQAQGDGSHTITWTTGPVEGVRHFGVNALSRGTLYDDEAPYDSQAWILPFLAGSLAVADLAP